MVNSFLRIYDFLHARRPLFYCLLAASVALLVAMVSTLRYNEDINDFIPMDESQHKAITLYQDITGGQRVVAMVRMKDGSAENADRLAEAVDTFTSMLKAHDGVRHIKDITSQVDFDKIVGLTDFAYRNLPYMLTDGDYEQMERTLSSTDTIGQRLERDVQQMMMPATGAFATNIGYDPLGLFAPLMKRMQTRQASLPFEMDNGYIFTADKRYAIVMMTSKYGSMESANNTLLVNYVDSVARQTMERLSDVDVAITGSPVIAVDYPLHFVAHISHGGNIRDVLKDMVSPLLIGNITTVGAFACLIPLDAPALRDLGLFAAFMLVGTILFVLVFLPHLVKPSASQGKERLLFGKISTAAPKLHWWIIGAIAVLTAVFGFFSLRTSFDSDMHHINYLTPTQERLMADLHISAGVKDSGNVYVVAEGDTWEEALNERGQLRNVLDSLRGKGAMASCTDVTSFVCSEATQAERLSKWNAFWAKHRQPALDALEAQAPRYGFSDEAFGDFRDIITAEYTTHPFDYFEPLVSSLFAQSFSRGAGRCAVIDVAEAGKGSVESIEEAVNNTNGVQAFSFDFVGMNSAVANALSDNFNYIGFACSFIVFVFLWLSMGRLELSLLAFMPMAVGWLWILGIMYLLGMQFNIVNIILATFIFGQGDDYTIFMTDGLVNEYAYRKKLLPSYKNSILISALIMFIGMGSLIVAKHPALHSLAEVTIVGMLSVVLMAWLIPPMMFHWLTKTGGAVRKSPVTLGQLLRTTYCAIAYLAELALGCAIGLTLKLLPCRKDAAELWFHRFIHKVMQLNVSHIAGVRINIHNPHGERFDRGGIIISNHQSILDPILMLALSPKVLILISGKVWRNPIVHSLFKLAGFILLNQPMDKLKEEMAAAVAKGYNLVIFPEGKRNDGKMTRFHKGAFGMAQTIGADILPIYLHGVSHVMPKGSGFAMRGQIDLEIGQRIPAAQLACHGATLQEMATNFHRAHKEHCEAMRKRIATTHYFHHYLIGKYTYKGWGLEKETRQLLRSHDDFSRWIDNYTPMDTSDNRFALANAGQGQFALMFALVHPDMEVHAYISNPDDVALAAAISPKPANLYIHDNNAEPLPHDWPNTLDVAKTLKQTNEQQIRRHTPLLRR